MLNDSATPQDRTFDTASEHLLPVCRDEDKEARTTILSRLTPGAIDWTVERLTSGGVVAIPTDTVYGIAASLAHQSALQRVFAIKNRPLDRPMPVLVSSVAAFGHHASQVSALVLPLLDQFWPGPLTVVVPARSDLPPEVLGTGNTVGFRLPNHPLTIEIIDKAGGAVACTSANKSGANPARTAQQVADSIGTEVDLILDGGVAPGGVASTVVAIDDNSLRFLREGAIPIEAIVSIWDEIIAAT